MQSTQFQKALNLMKKTGMGMIIMDEKTDHAYVLMGIEEYETGLEVSHDMGVMDAAASEEDSRESPDIWNVMPEAGSESETWDPKNLSETESKELERQYEVFAAKNAGEVKTESKELDLSALKIEEQKKEEDFGEEEFYLEPVD